jgi:hypothetical protein
VAESDLERRVARLERGVRLAQSRAGRVATAIERTRGAVLVRRLPIVPPAGNPGITIPCCGSLQLPATLKLRQPDGTPVDLTWGTTDWSGLATVQMDASGNTSGPLLNIRIAYRLGCYPGSSGPSWFLTAAGDGYTNFGIVLPREAPAGSPPPNLPCYAYPPVLSGPGVCDPINLTFTHRQNLPVAGPNGTITVYSSFRWSGGIFGQEPPGTWLAYAP